MMSLIRKIYFWAKHPFEYHPHIQRKVKFLETIGNYGCSFTVDVSHLNANMRIYSFGMGEDISFELGLLNRIGGGTPCCMHSIQHLSQYHL